MEDLGISEISDIVLQQVQKDQSTLETEEGVEVLSLASSPDNQCLETPIQQRLRVNLVRHRFSRATDMPTIQLFKSLILALRKADKQLTILPIDSKKQHYTSLVSLKQIESLNERQLSMYFTPWFKEQHYSLSGYLHFSSILSFNDLFNHTAVAEWLDTYQYSVKKCPSQSEEMSLVGALCYGSTWIYREDLKQKIMQHPIWTTLHPDQESPIIVDLIQRPFRSSEKSIPMIFVTSERSKMDLVRAALSNIYDGTAKAYPRGDMLFFIPTKGNDP